MAFKDLQTSLNKLSSDFKGQIAKNNPMLKGDTKNMSFWIYQERQVLSDLKALTYEESQAIKSMELWSKDEGEDFEDVIGKLATLLKKKNAIETELAVGIQRYRQTLKLIREKEGNLAASRDKKRYIESKQAGSHWPSLKGKGVDVIGDLSSLEQECRNQEQDLADFKRFAVREAFYVRFNALTEYAEKLAMIAGFGKYLVDQISIEPTPHGQPRQPYTGREQTSMIMEDAFAAIDAWCPTEQDERPTIDIPDRQLSIDIPWSPSERSSVELDSHSIVESPAVDTHPPPLPARPPRTPTRPTAPPLPPHPSLADMPPAYNESAMSMPVPSAPEPPAELTEATEYSTPYQSHAQSYQLPNEASSPVLSYLSSDHTSNYNQLYRHVSSRTQHRQRPYSEYRAQQQQRIGASGFTVPTQSNSVSSAEEEKRQLAERERLEEEARRQTTANFSGSSAPPYWSMPPPVNDQPQQHTPGSESRHSYTSAHNHTTSPGTSSGASSDQLPQYYRS